MIETSSVAFGNLRIYSVIFGKCLEMFGKCSETFVRLSEQFWKIFGKWSEIFGKSSKTVSSASLYNKKNIKRLLKDMNFISNIKFTRT